MAARRALVGPDGSVPRTARDGGRAIVHAARRLDEAIQGRDHRADRYALIMYGLEVTCSSVPLVVRGLRGFDWDAANWRKSEIKQGIAASEAEDVLLGDPLCQVDARHSEAEQRYVALGTTNDEGRRLFVAFTIRRNQVRVISARPMSRKERRIHDAAKEAIQRR